MGRIAVPLEDRLQSKLKVMLNGCWEFQGARNEDGYGEIYYGPSTNKIVKAHRAMWELVFGLIPHGLEVMHKCDNPPCCTPSHLFIGTHQDNMSDMAMKGRSVSPTKQKRGRGVKLKWEQIPGIKADNRSGVLIAKELGVCNSTIYRIKRGETWKEDL